MENIFVNYKISELKKLKFNFKESPSVMNSSFVGVLNSQSDKFI